MFSYVFNTSKHKLVEVSDCEILRHHDSRAMTYHDCVNHHDCHKMQIFSTNKQTTAYEVLSDTCYCAILRVL